MEDSLKVSLTADPVEVSVKQNISEKLLGHSHQQGLLTSQLLSRFGKGMPVWADCFCLLVSGSSISLLGLPCKVKLGGLTDKKLFCL